MFSKASLISLLSLVPFALAQANAQADLVGKLRLAPTQVDRINLLKDSDFLFDFNGKTGETIAAGGRLVNANAGTFPAVIDNGVAMALGVLQPCGINSPHTHPRATEIQFAVNATIRTGFLAENGARFVLNDVPAGSAAIFPKGSIHFQVNDNCYPAMFVAAFNNEDPGALQIPQRFFGLPPDIVDATLGDIGVEKVVGIEANIPNNPVQGVAACLKRCNIKPVTQSTSQRQPRVAGNALPSGSGSGAGAPAAPAKAALGASSHLSDFLGSAAASSSGSNNSNPNLPLTIALLVVNGVFVLGALVAVFFYIRSKRNDNSRTGRRELRLSSSDMPQFIPVRDAEKEREFLNPYSREHSPARP